MTRRAGTKQHVMIGAMPEPSPAKTSVDGDTSDPPEADGRGHTDEEKRVRAQRIKAVRHAVEMTQPEVTKAAGWPNHTYLSRIENPKNYAQSYEHMRGLGVAYGVGTDDFANYADGKITLEELLQIRESRKSSGTRVIAAPERGMALALAMAREDGAPDGFLLHFAEKWRTDARVRNGRQWLRLIESDLEEWRLVSHEGSISLSPEQALSHAALVEAEAIDLEERLEAARRKRVKARKLADMANQEIAKRKTDKTSTSSTPPEKAKRKA